MLAGHRILNKAGVWQEDIRPVHRAGVLSFEGTAENAEVRERVTREIRRAAGERQVKFELRERQEDPADAAGPSRKSANQTAAARASGGGVRSSLLSHFSDAARRSFQTPEPSALESELDRYVSDVFRSQSRLLSHVYALNGVLTTFDVSLVRPSRAGVMSIPSGRWSASTPLPSGSTKPVSTIACPRPSRDASGLIGLRRTKYTASPAGAAKASSS